MKADKCRHRLSTIQQSYGGHIDPMLKELDELEAKAAELDRRERGVCVEEKAIYSTGMDDYIDYFACGACEFGVSQHWEPEIKYCSGCGTKIIWPEY